MKTTNLLALAAISFGLAVLALPPRTADRNAVPAPLHPVHPRGADTHAEVTAIPQSKAAPGPNRYAVNSYASGLHTGP
ncbi:MAG: hypothetical protein ACO289_02095 [Prochlorococcaceae cyanobacterium]